ncbi:Pituitary homeobox 3 [Frankliniella fusca]|uniref:Pituitary homeobox 3 n=1 Tax=Frankliniella fusca TaxID=407009 RepID=A0AAE1HMQ0_9NEOP|nr:Pituitary homeobox 3 [Frankliniella fusca]
MEATLEVGIGKENVLPTSPPFVRRTRSTKCLSPNRQVTPATSPFRLDPELNTVPVESDGNSSPSFDCTPKLRSSIQRKRPRRSPPVCSPPAHTPRTSPPTSSDGPTGSASLTSAILSELGSTFQQGKSQSTSTAIPSSSGGLTGSASLTSTILSELGNPFQGESQSTSTAIPSSSVGPTGSASLTSAILSELESTFQQGKSQSTSTAIPSSSGGLTGSASLTSSSILSELGSTFQGESQSTSPSSSGVLTWQEETEGEESDKEADDQTGEQGESEQHDEEEEGQQHGEGEEEKETEQDSSEDEEEEDGPPRKRQRRQRTESKFLPNHLTEKLMYDEYCKKEDNPVSRWTYSRELKKLGLKFKPLHVDTCQRCDALDAAVKYSKTEQEKEENLLKQQLHHKKSQDAIEQKKADKAKAKTSETTETIAFDLQQCLPTPHLSTSMVFYLRQLWVYNLTVHTMSTGKSVHYMWHEGEGGRGANQVGSALFHYISALPDQVERLILWSDTCAGQNKNGIINSALITALSQKKTLKFIDQKFLVSGHTHLECDSDHAIIENKKKHISEIHLPRDWYNLVRNASNKFTVQPLRQHQLDFKALHTGKGSPLVKRKVTTTKEKFVWKDVVWIQHRRDLRPGVIAFKKSFDEDEEFEYLDMRRYQRGDMVLSPKPAYDGPVKISAKKKKDLLSMLHLLDPECHPFYNSLLTDDAIPEDLDPDIPASSDDADSEGE